MRTGRAWSVLLLSIAMTLSAAGVALAVPVGLDPTFGSGNPVLTPIGTPIGSADARAASVARLGDGKLVAAGYARDGRNNKFAVAKYNADGSLDTAFGTGGTVLTPIGLGDGSDDEGKALAVQGDGKLVVAGYAASGIQEFALARYNANGSLDTTFHPNGTLLTGFPGTVVTLLGNASICRALSLVVQPDGKLVAGGYARVGATAKFALVRYNPDASLDTTFGAGGKVLTAVGNGTFAAIKSLALQPDGKLVAAGLAADGSGHARFALARYNANGTLDTSFGSGGTVLTAVGSGDAELNSMIVDGLGRLVVAGSALDGQSTAFALVRYQAGGSLDAGFGSSGIVLTPVGEDNAAEALSLTTRGRQLVAAGVASDDGAAKFALARYRANGALDLTFNSTGTVLTQVGDGSFAAATSVVQDGQRPVVAGYARDGGGNVFALARLKSLPVAASQPAPPVSGSSTCFERLGAVICPGSPGAHLTAVRCSVASGSVRMSRSGRVKLPVRCAGAAKGMLTLRKGSVLGRASFSMKRGSSRTVKVKLSKRAKRMVLRHRKLRVRATVSPNGARASRTSRSVTIRAPLR